MRLKIAVVIPCYRVSENINKVLSKIPKFIDKIYIVDDNCPEKSYLKVKKNKNYKIIIRGKNGGVGAAVKDGYISSIKDKNDIVVRIDGDGQMDPRLIKKFIKPLIDNKADFTKGNRLSKKIINSKMPIGRNLGNIFFSILGRFSTGNHTIFDFLNGYTAINLKALKLIKKDFNKIDNDYFFETSTIFYLTKNKIKILDISMNPLYANEKSSLNVISTTIIFILKNIRLIYLRLFYF